MNGVIIDVFERVDDAIDALLKGDVEALVYEAPTLQKDFTELR